MKAIRYILLTVICLVIFMSGFSNVWGEPLPGKDSDISIDRFDTNRSGKIRKDDVFLINIFQLRNYSGDKLENVFVTIQPNTSFFLPNAGGREPVGEIDVNGDKTISFSSPVKYTGTGNILNFAIEYSKGGVDYKIFKSVTVNTEEYVETPSTPIDTSTLIPRIAVLPGIKMPELIAGKSTGLSLPLKNISNHTARDVSISIDFGSLTTYIIPDSVKLVQDIDILAAGKEGSVLFPLKLRQDTPAGVYLITLSYSCRNIFNKDFSYTENIYIRVENDYTPPKLYVNTVTTDPSEIVPGQEVTLDLKIYNSGTGVAKNVKVQITGLRDDTLRIYNMGNTKSIGSILGNAQKSLGFSLMASNKLIGTSCPIGVKLEYEDELGEKYVDEQEVYLTVRDDSEEGDGLLNFKDIRLSSASVIPGDTFDVTFRIANTGEGKASNIEVWLEGGQGMITKSLTPLRIKGLNAGQETELTFTVLSDKNLKGRIPLAIKAQYQAGPGQTAVHTITQYIEVEMAVSEDEKETVPRIIVEKYSFSPEVVKAGTEFILKMSFLNTNKEIPVRNIKVSLTSGDGTFTPTVTSNTFYIDEIDPGNAVGKEIELYPKADATPKLYPIELKMEYEDHKGNQHTAIETLNIPLKQEPRLQTSDFSIPPQVFVGQATPLYVDYYNMGKSILYNLMVKLEGEIGGDNSSYFAGNFEPGRSDYYEGMIIPEKPGELACKLVFEFEDETGEQHRIEKEFTVYAMEMQPMDPMDFEKGLDPGMIRPGMGIEERAQGKSYLIYIAAGVGLGIILLIVFLIVRRKRKRAAEGIDLNEHF